MPITAGEIQEKRSKERDLAVGEVVDPARREAAESDDALWLRTYCPDVFYNPFTLHQLRIIADCGEALSFGTQKCKAAPRGDGKSSIAKYLALKYTLTRRVRFPLVIGATTSKSRDMLDSLKRRLASKARTALSEDYPLECTVAQYVNPWPSRARNVSANGQRKIHVEWGPDHIILPTWEDEEPLGPILMCLGITSDDIQGCNIYDQRPDFVILDDLDSRDSLASEDGVVAKKIEEAIDKTIGGLAGQSRRLGQFYLCTITSRESAAYRYSDPKIKPAYSGERIKAVEKWPTAAGLWDDYIELRHNGQSTFGEDGRPIDPHGRAAFRHYLANRDEMDAGAVVANPYNYIQDILPDGTPTHLSALQKCYDYIADRGLDSFLTEHQNDPPEKESFSESAITPEMIQRKVSGVPRGIIPPGCVLLTQGIDCNKRGLHWTVRAWKADGTGYVIAYGVHEVRGTVFGKDDGLDVAIHRAILERIEATRDENYCFENGEVLQVDLTCVDAGYRTDAVYAACHQIGVGVMPIMGFGKSSGCTQADFSAQQRATVDKRPGDGWFLSRKGKVWLVCADADRWKAWEHDRWLADPGKPGSLQIFGKARPDDIARMSDDQRDHHSYARHICSETEVEEPHKGTLRRRWKAKHENNHWLDASYYASVAMSIRGLRLEIAAPSNASRRAPEATKRPS
jgi:hypothetical protein